MVFEAQQQRTPSPVGESGSFGYTFARYESFGQRMAAGLASVIPLAEKLTPVSSSKNLLESPFVTFTKQTISGNLWQAVKVVGACFLDFPSFHSVIVPCANSSSECGGKGDGMGWQRDWLPDAKGIPCPFPCEILPSPSMLPATFVDEQEPDGNADPLLGRGANRPAAHSSVAPPLRPSSKKNPLPTFKGIDVVPASPTFWVQQRRIHRIAGST